MASVFSKWHIHYQRSQMNLHLLMFLWCHIEEIRKRKQYTTSLSELLIKLENIFLEIRKVSHLFIVKFVLFYTHFKKPLSCWRDHSLGKVVVGGAWRLNLNPWSPHTVEGDTNFIKFLWPSQTCWGTHPCSTL